MSDVGVDERFDYNPEFLQDIPDGMGPKIVVISGDEPPRLYEVSLVGAKEGEKGVGLALRQSGEVYTHAGMHVDKFTVNYVTKKGRECILPLTAAQKKTLPILIQNAVDKYGVTHILLSPGPKTAS